MQLPCSMLYISLVVFCAELASSLKIKYYFGWWLTTPPPFSISGSDLQQIINDSCAEVGSSSSDFWVMVAALKVGDLKVN